MSKTVAITGATRGLGRALAEGFAARGHAVAGCGRSEDALADLAATLGPPHDFAVVDVTDAAAVADWTDRVLAALGPPDLLVANAGLINHPAPLWEVDPREFSAVLDVNVKGVWHALRSFLPPMIARGAGVVVVVTSGWGRSVDRDVGPYCASKWALEGMARALAEELPPGLAAIPVNPGVIDTGMLRTCWGEEAGGYPSPAAWAERAVPFLLGLGPEQNGRPLTVS